MPEGFALSGIKYNNMTHYQGEDIEFAITLKNLGANDMKSWNDASRIVVYFYTHASYIAKFSNKVEAGYRQLTKVSDTQLTAVIPSADTRVFEGPLICDVYIHPKTGDVEQIRRVSTGITIEYTPIKEETR